MEFFGYIVVIAISYFISPYVNKLLDKASENIELINPEGISKEDWESFVAPKGRVEAGKWLGVLERILAFFSFYVDAYGVIGGWLAFKLGSKWQVWASVIKMPEKDEFSYLRARQRWGSWLHTRFLIGTLCNVLVGFILARSLKMLLS